MLHSDEAALVPTALSRQDVNGQTISKGWISGIDSKVAAARKKAWVLKSVAPSKRRCEGADAVVWGIAA